MISKTEVIKRLATLPRSRLPAVAASVVASVLAGAVIARDPIVGTLVMVGLVGSCAVLASPYLGWIILAVGAPIVMVAYGQSSVPTLVMTAVIAATVAGLQLRRDCEAGPARGAILAMIGSLIVSVIWGTVMWPSATTFRDGVLALVLISVPLLLGVVRLPAQIAERATLLFLSGSLPVAAISALEFIRSDSVTAGIASSVETNHNTLGLVYVFGIIAALTVRLPIKSPIGVLLTRALVCALLAIAIIATFSRSSFLALLATGLVFSFLRGARAAPALLALVLVALVVVPESVWIHLASTIGLTGTGVDLSSTTRVDLWNAALRMFASSPIVGVGFQGFSEALPSHWTGTSSGLLLAAGASDYAYAHNIVLTILATGGLIGALAFGWLTARLVAIARRSDEPFRTRGILGLVAAGVASLFGEPVLTTPVIVLLMLLVPHGERRVSA